MRVHGTRKESKTRVGSSIVQLLAACVFVGSLAGQSAPPKRPRLEGDWTAKADSGIRHIMVRPDSSAQFGDQVARWRLVGDSIWLTVGDGVWMVYGLRVSADRLTLSGGDLQKPVTLKRVGPPSPKPDTLTVPASPPDTARAWD